MRETVQIGFAASVLLVAAGALAWVSGLPFMFPSLGPSAFLLSAEPNAPESQPRRVVGGHAIGVVVGLATYHLVAPGVALAGHSAPLSPDALRLAVSGVVSVGVTSAGMFAADARHAPACATTLIVSLGLLPTFPQGLIVIGAVALLVAVQRGLIRAGLFLPGPTILRYRDQ